MEEGLPVAACLLRSDDHVTEITFATTETSSPKLLLGLELGWPLMILAPVLLGQQLYILSKQDCYGKHGETATVRLILAPSQPVAALRGLAGPSLGVWHTFRGLSLSRVTPVLFAQAGQHLHVSAASIWVYLLLGVESLGMETNAGFLLGNGQLFYVHWFAPGTPTAWQDCCQSTSKACRMALEIRQMLPKRNGSSSGFLNLLKPCCSLGCSWFLMDVSTSNKFLVQ